jgi:hypothetical protein
LSDPQVNIDRPQGAGSPIPTHRLLFKPKEPALRHPVGSARDKEAFMIKPIALTFALAMALTPAAALAQNYGYPETPAHGTRVHHHTHMRPVHRRPVTGPVAGYPETGPVAGYPAPWPSFGYPMTGPVVGQMPHGNADLPAISRDPEDCNKTMCTCLAGGGC